METKHTTKICYHCGGDIAIHKFESNYCPVTINYESNLWRTTKFEDSGLKKLHEAAPYLLEACILLLDELNSVYSSAYCQLSGDDYNIQKAESAIKKATL